MMSSFRSLAVGALIGGASLLAATPGAQAVPITDLIANNGTIIDDDKEFSNFTCSVASMSGNTGGGCTSLMVDPIPGDTVGLQFTGGLSAFGPGASELDVIIGYDATVLDPNQQIEQISLLFNGTITGLNAFTSITETVFDQPGGAGNIIGQIAVTAPIDLQDPPFEILLDIPLAAPVSSLSVIKDVLLVTTANAGVGEAATISLIDQNFKQTVPEPGTLGLLGSGLLALGALGAWRRRRAGWASVCHFSPAART